MPGDVEQFDARAERYDESALGRRFHLPVQEAVLGIAARLAPRPEAILDVGCGTGSLLRLAADRFPTARLYGADPAEAMVAVAAADPRLTVARASAERLPFADAGFDLILSTNSFHHWEDKAMGIAEIARVLRSGGHLVLADPFAIGWLRALAALLRRRDRLWSGAQVDGSLAGVGLETRSWETVHRVGPVTIIHAATARRL